MLFALSFTRFISLFEQDSSRPALPLALSRSWFLTGVRPKFSFLRTIHVGYFLPVLTLDAEVCFFGLAHDIYCTTHLYRSDTFGNEGCHWVKYYSYWWVNEPKFFQKLNFFLLGPLLSPWRPYFSVLWYVFRYYSVQLMILILKEVYRIHDPSASVSSSVIWESYIIDIVKQYDDTVVSGVGKNRFLILMVYTFSCRFFFIWAVTAYGQLSQSN